MNGAEINNSVAMSRNLDSVTQLGFVCASLSLMKIKLEGNWKDKLFYSTKYQWASFISDAASEKTLLLEISRDVFNRIKEVGLNVTER